MNTTSLRSDDTAQMILLCGALVLAISLGVRHTFGLFLQPISYEQGWGREVFGFAIALQNLVWGLAQPFAGMLADRKGTLPVVVGGAILFVAGVGLMSVADSTWLFVLAAGGLVGLGLSGITMPVVFGAISRTVSPDRRSMAFGVAMSVGSLGQFVLLPGSLLLMDGVGWQLALQLLAGLSILILPLALVFRGEAERAPATLQDQTALQAARSALSNRGFQLLSFGYFVCGFQVVFIATHIPAFLVDQGLSASVGSTVLALIGLFNIFGSLAAGWLGGRFRKPAVLTFIYLGRAVAIVLFLVLPITALSAYTFAVIMGLLWLSTVPLTNGAVASMFGVRNMAMLGGLVYLAHQVGAFFGGWLGGTLHDALGSYDAVWGIALVLSLMAGALNWPIRDVAQSTPLAEGRA